MHTNLGTHKKSCVLFINKKGLLKNNQKNNMKSVQCCNLYSALFFYV